MLTGGLRAERESKKPALAMAGMPPESAPRVDADNAALIARLRVSREGREGITAFLEKCKPAWAR